MSLRLLTSAALCFALVGCAGSGRPTAALPAVRVTPPEEVADKAFYGDRTSQTAAMTGAMCGLMAGVIGGAIAAGSIHSGQKRFEPVTRQHRNAIGPIIQRNIQTALTQTGKLPASTGKSSEIQLRLKSVNHGVGHAGGQRFAPMVAA